MTNVFSSKMRLLFFFWFLLLLSLLTLGWFYYHNLKQDIIAEAEKSAIQSVNLVHWMLEKSDALQGPEQLQKDLQAMGAQMGIRITYVQDGGQVIADSDVPPAKISSLDNHAMRPEIIQARERQVGLSIRFSRTSAKELIYAAKTVSAQDRVPAGVVRVAIPWSNLRERFDRLNKTLLCAIFLTFAVIAAVSYVLIRQLDKPVQAMINATEAIGRGHYKQRIQFHPRQEFYLLGRSINTMAELIDKQIQTITAQKQQLEAIFNGMREGLMVLDSQGKIRSVNRAMTEIIPNVHNSIGRRPLEVTMSLELQKACDFASSNASGSDNYPYTLQIALQGGERVYDVSIVRLIDGQEGVGSIVVFHDISELKRLEKVRQDFVANVSHELRTPLTSIKGYTETLLAEQRPDPQTLASFLQVILRNTNHMVKMVDDLLQLARLEAQPGTTRAVAVNAAESLNAAWKACAPVAQAKGVELQHELPEKGLEVMADFDQLVQVFRNLLENAIKYSPPNDSIAVGYELEGNRVTFRVSDNGPGIPKQHQQRIFERFYRVEKIRSHHPGSTGLGLSICRHIILNSGGKIWVQSPSNSDGTGTTVFFTFFSPSR